MSHSDTTLPSTGRIEAFSDGVVAIIVTIMVLELKLPAGALDSHSLGGIATALGPKLFGYVVSFVTVSNSLLTHHTLMREAPYATTALYWWNAFLLFWLSLVPFTTAALGDSPREPLAVALFAVVFLLVAIAFALLHGYTAWLATANGATATHSSVAVKLDLIAACLYAAAIPLAWLSVYLSDLIFAGVAAAYFLPVHRQVDPTKG